MGIRIKSKIKSKIKNSLTRPPAVSGYTLSRGQSDERLVGKDNLGHNGKSPWSQQSILHWILLGLLGCVDIPRDRLLFFAPPLGYLAVRTRLDLTVRLDLIVKLAFMGWLGLVLLSFAPVCATQQQAQAASPKTAQPQAASTQKNEQQGIELFEKQIRPVLIDKCYCCHSKSAETIEGGLELDSPVGLARGGDSGPAITKPDISGLMIPDQGDLPDRGQQNPAETPGPKSQAANSLLLRRAAA